MSFISDQSSKYSSIPSRYSVYSETDTPEKNEKLEFPPRRPYSQGNEHYVANPYARSLWFNARGENGKDTIEDIQNRVLHYKRKQEDEPLMAPPRYNSLSTKKVDSPITNSHFFKGSESELNCPSPKYKGLPSTFKATKYRRAFWEILETEKKYMEHLKLIQSVYRTLLHSRSYKDILSKTQESTIFSNIDTLIDLSELLLKDIAKKARAEYNGKLNLDLFEHFRFCNVENIDIGDILINQCNRFRISYISYAQNQEAQLNVLRQCEKNGGPKVRKWLDESSFLVKSRSNCWDLESLLIKPIQRIAKYPLLVDSLLVSLNSHISVENVEHLYEAKTKLINSLKQINNSQNNNIGDACNEKRVGNREERLEYKKLVEIFKKKVDSLQSFKKETDLSVKPLLRVVSYNREFAEKWMKFMNYEDRDSPKEEHFIKSIYSSFHERVLTQEQKILLVRNEIQENIIKAIDLILEYCGSVKHKINKHNSYKGAYIHYIKYGKKSTNHTVSHSLKDAQQYVIIENEIKNELPEFLAKIELLQHNLVLKYTSLILKWFEVIAGSKQIQSFQELLKSNSLVIGDNFDIIELYSLAKHSTSQAIKEICIKPSFDDAQSLLSGTNSTESTGDLKISSSRVVRRLFGI